MYADQAPETPVLPFNLLILVLALFILLEHFLDLCELLLELSVLFNARKEVLDKRDRAHPHELERIEYTVCHRFELNGNFGL